MRRTLIAATLLAVATAWADDASKRIKAEQMIELTGGKQVMDQMMGSMRQMIMAQIPPDVAEKGGAEMAARMAEVISKGLSWDYIKKDLVDVYVQTYSEGELDGIVAFYQSPAGKAFVAKMPQLVEKSMTLGQKWMNEMRPEFERVAKETMESRSAAPASSSQNGRSAPTDLLRFEERNTKLEFMPERLVITQGGPPVRVAYREVKAINITEGSTYRTVKLSRLDGSEISFRLFGRNDSKVFAALKERTGLDAVGTAAKKVSDGWQQLRAGMTPSEVQNLLGFSFMMATDNPEWNAPRVQMNGAGHTFVFENGRLASWR